MTQILQAKQLHLEATEASTKSVLKAEAPHSTAMEQVLEALSSEQNLLKKRLAEIQKHTEKDIQMLEELKDRGNQQLETLDVSLQLKAVITLIETGPEQLNAVHVEAKEEAAVAPVGEGCATASRLSHPDMETMLAAEGIQA